MTQASFKAKKLCQQVEARDADEGRNAALQFRLLDDSSGFAGRRFGGSTRAKNNKKNGSNKTKDVFAIDSRTGELKLAAALDPLEDVYNLIVEAHDAGES